MGELEGGGKGSVVGGRLDGPSIFVACTSGGSLKSKWLPEKGFRSGRVGGTTTR
jgi:hypothetical protein